MPKIDGYCLYLLGKVGDILRRVDGIVWVLVDLARLRVSAGGSCR